MFTAALAVLWLIVARTYPTITAARYWAVSALAGTVGLAIFLAAPRDVARPLVVLAGSAIVLGNTLAWAGIRRYVHRTVPLRTIAGIMTIVIAGLIYSAIVAPNIGVRTVIISLAQGWLLLLASIDLFRARPARRTLGIR